MTARPRVSVVMPIYNGRRFVADAVASVRASHFTDLELLIIDDGSTDGSADEATRAAGRDRRVHVLTLPRGGVAAARNVGLHRARGEFIANLDADDLMLPERLDRQVAYLDRHPECVAVGSRALIVDGDGNPLRVGGRVYTHEAIDEAHLDGRPGAILNPTATFRRQAALSIGGYAGHLKSTGEDHDLWLRLAEVGRLANLPEVLVRYRVHGANVSVGPGAADRRRATTLATLQRAHERRGLADRRAEPRDHPPIRTWERWCDAALVHYFSGRRRRAVIRGFAAWLLQPHSPATRSALRTVASLG